jgi:SAM-dependent methyltransferase
LIEPPDPATAAALARLYDLDLGEDPGDIDLYRALADRAGGPILELAVGSGRVAVPLARAGYTVTGVDLDTAMLARARARATEAGVPGERLALHEADLVDARLPDAGRYAFAYLALNSLMVLPDRDAQRAALRTLAVHLAPGGIAAVDVWLPDADDLGRYDGRVILEWIRPDPTTGALVAKTGSAVHDAATGTIVLTSMFDEARQGEPASRWIRQDRLRLVSADELSEFAEAAGLRVELVAGGYDLGDFGPGAERAVLVAERA